jgi:hypothetical protein
VATAEILIGVWQTAAFAHAAQMSQLRKFGITGVAAALPNAVFYATGKRVRDLPITLDKLL